MDLPTTHPRALQPGDAIGVIAPAGPVSGREDFLRGVNALEHMGFRVKYSERIFESTGYLAGSDAGRASELMRCFEDPATRAVFALRGGYGCARLIPLLDEHRLRHFPKFFMGFSDLTTLHLFFRRRLGWVTVHGPMVVSPALANLGGEYEKHLIALLSDAEYRPQYAFPQLQSWVAGSAEGVLAGGCLSLITASIGTSYEIKTEGKILFLEDLGEPPYRLDRMLTHLELAGKLDGVAGFVLGTFQECDTPDSTPRAEDVLRERLVRLGIPTLAGLPAGHGTENWPLPMGVRVRLDCERRTLFCLEPAAS